MFDATFAAQFDALLHWRRDVRHFQRRPVPDADMLHLFESAALAPSVGHAQPWRFIRIRSADIRMRLAAHVDGQSAQAATRHDHDPVRRDHYLSLKLHGLREAPEVLAVCSDERPDAGHGLGIATMPEMLRYSTVMAIHTLWLAARVRGIGIGWVSILDPQTVLEILEPPADWSLIALLCVGYPDAASAVPELERRGWQAREPWTARVIER